MATDVNARSIVSRSMSDMLKIERNQFERERRAMNLNYGCLFIAHELTAGGMKMTRRGHAPSGPSDNSSNRE